MPNVTVRIPMPLRTCTRGADAVSIEGGTVGEVLAALTRTHDGLANRVLTPEGEVRSFVNVFLGDENISTLQGLKTPVTNGATLTIIPAVAGGSGLKARDRRLLELRGQIPPVTPQEAATV